MFRALRCVVLVALLLPPALARALSCTPLGELDASKYFNEASVVVLGRALAAEDPFHQGWSDAVIVRLGVEQLFKGPPAPEVRVVLPGYVRQGDRVLVFARKSLDADRLLLSQQRFSWRAQTAWSALNKRTGDGQRSDADQRRLSDLAYKANSPRELVLRPDADMPNLDASGACNPRVYVLGQSDKQAEPLVRELQGQLAKRSDAGQRAQEVRGGPQHSMAERPLR